MRSGEIAQLAGVTVRTLRHYRSIGLLPEPKRADNGYCEYALDDLLRLLRIKHLAALGFSLEDIGDMLDTLDSDDRSKATDLLDELDRELARQIEDLEQQRKAVALIKSEEFDADIPIRFAAITSMLKEHGLPDDAVEGEREVMLLAAAILRENDLNEAEAIYRALVDRDVVDEYIHINEWVMALSDEASEAEKAAVVDKILKVFEPIMDCFDTSNWEAEPTEIEQMGEAILKQYQTQTLNSAQKEVCDRTIAALENRVKSMGTN